MSKFSKDGALPSVLIIGTGFGGLGLGMAIHLKQAGAMTACAWRRSPAMGRPALAI